ncbi:hypothetical protein WA026_011253 [Henosepilachna vigintioctopunctata]|uniref:Borealin C-terminal domain-containing protein n=1 Tax=Henosepilachna vigintioctopunctata TaxID=420089 RepID=A0AAW1U7C6_9CUCU
MPRTKQVRKAENPKESLALNKDIEATSNFEEFQNAYKLKKFEILEEKKAHLAAFKLEMKQDKLTIPVSIGNKKIKDLKLGNCSLWQSTLTSFSTHSSSVLRDNHQTKSSLNDDGGKRQTRASKRSTSELKAEETGSRSKKILRTSRSLSRSNISEQPPASNNVERASRSRSLSRNKYSRTSTFDKYKTPKNTRKIENFGTVTPKMKPNTPHVVLRRPQQGEIAISLQGSPLMTTAMVTETTANLNIPLPDGRLINIQPRKGLRASEIPELDPDIQKQLQTLRENLDKVCQYVCHK